MVLNWLFSYPVDIVHEIANQALNDIIVEMNMGFKDTVHLIV